MTIDLDLVKQLISKKNEDGKYTFTAYKIEQEVGFSREIMSKLRKGDKKLENITLGKIIDLNKFAQKHKEQLL